jgi:hypothetical protein
MDKLNPNSKLVREAETKTNEANKKRREEALKTKRGISKSLSKD